MARLRSITKDPRYPELVAKYRYDWIRASVDLFGKEPTWQQQIILEAIEEPGSKVSVSSGHGTGKSDMTSIMVICYMLFFPNAMVNIVANKISQVQQVVWKYLRLNWKELCRRHPWVEQYFVLTDTTFYEITGKGVWFVAPKGCRIGNEESLAGSHAKHLLYIVDEASGVSDKAFGVMTGALTEEDNRMLLLSQPTRNGGFFYDTHHKLVKRGPDDKDGWTAIKLNSEESPIVKVGFIRMKLREYGGSRDAPEYMIKVRGEFPKSLAGYLLTRDECERSGRAKPRLDESWGWVLTVDVGNGRDSSVANLARVSGDRFERRVVPHSVKEWPGTIDPVNFGRLIAAEYPREQYPNITVAVDGDGVGADTATILEEAGVAVHRIRWGQPCFSDDDKTRFLNKRALANIMARDAVKSGRLKLDTNEKTLDQASRIPCRLNEQGQWCMMPKDKMRKDLGLPSPDRWDTYCFHFLTDYIPAAMVITDDMRAEHESVSAWAKELVAEDI
ncbi:terminase [Aeromonas sp. Y318-3]|uniref:terminase n=1 Tax=Aeromonas sp. Y318-3 TaxID=2990509 RepID=UPI0022E07437|nr:terminase [Aeromonas sp. Y318-3]